MLSVACVLRSGGSVYTAEYVRRLADGVWQHLPGAYRMVCLTDDPDAMPEGVEALGLHHDWPGWWAKIELFRPGIFDGPVLYMDLDTVIRGSLEELAHYPHRFTMLSDFYAPQYPASGLMAWEGDYRRLYERFAADPARHIAGHCVTGDFGDGGYIAQELGFAPDRFQDLLPGQVASYKATPDRSAARVVCYHGKPRPHETGWAA